jgi:transcriptional regulator with XRE-family HTH domain
MSPDFRRIAALNWQALVAEALRRRKAEKLTQREHAALASVSIPTIIAFDRGERTLSLGKAFDILRVVGLVDEPKTEGAQEKFVQEAFTRWRELTSGLAENSFGRFPNGWYRIDYALEGELKPIGPFALMPLLERAIVHHTGWPMFLFPHRPDLPAQEVDGVIECWLRPADGGVNRPLGDPAHCDFWRVAPIGRAFIIRGYQEDGQDTFPPQTVFDTTLPIWRLGEALLHARNLAGLLSDDPAGVTVRFRALYTGLSGRVLRSWASPFSDLLVEGGAARSDEAMLEVAVPAKEIDTDLARHLHPLVASLFERFGVTGLSVERVGAELERMAKNQLSSVRA